MAKQQPAKQKPVKVYRVGYVAASIFAHTSGDEGQREFHTLSLQRSYLDDDGKRQYTGSLSLGDLPNALRVLQLAQAFIESLEAEVVG